MPPESAERAVLHKAQKSAEEHTQDSCASPAAASGGLRRCPPNARSARRKRGIPRNAMRYLYAATQCSTWCDRTFLYNAV